MKLSIICLLLYNLRLVLCLSRFADPSPYGEGTVERVGGLDEPYGGAKSEDTWTGRWFPDVPGYKPPRKILPAGDMGHALNHAVQMGPSDDCDNGKTSLRVDWDLSPINYTCYGERIVPSYDLKPILYSEIIPSAYEAEHVCMSETIEYEQNVPVYGSHRPVWPAYGEYEFLPRQRWLHSIEHGAVVMLYHPCANPLEIKILKDIVKGCLRRHIISPSNLVDRKRPLVLVTWGSRLSMSYVNSTIVIEYIKEKALQGPEDIFRDGPFSEGLVQLSSNLNCSTSFQFLAHCLAPINELQTNCQWK